MVPHEIKCKITRNHIEFNKQYMDAAGPIPSETTTFAYFFRFRLTKRNRTTFSAIRHVPWTVKTQNAFVFGVQGTCLLAPNVIFPTIHKSLSWIWGGTLRRGRKRKKERRWKGWK